MPKLYAIVDRLADNQLVFEDPEDGEFDRSRSIPMIFTDPDVGNLFPNEDLYEVEIKLVKKIREGKGE